MQIRTAGPLPIIMAAIAVSSFSIAARAQDASACSGFNWPLETEISWLESADTETAQSGGELPALPAKAIALKLQPTKTVTFPVKPGMKKQGLGPESFSGFFTLTALPNPGIYQISLSHNAWIDVVQNKELMQSTGFTGKADCTKLRKSVRFEIGPGPVTVQIGGADVETIKVTIRPAS
jgi:hypothetical protein